MEAVNVVGSTDNQVTLHTSTGCSMGVKRKETGKVLATSCVNSTNDNAGCGVHAGTDTFGTSYNQNGGGVMAMELRSAGIRVWQFARNAIPSDVTNGSPDPSTWGEATADFPATDCDIGTHFRNQSIIADIDLCGSWAGTQTVYSETCKFDLLEKVVMSGINADFTYRLGYVSRPSREQCYCFRGCILGIWELFRL